MSKHELHFKERMKGHIAFDDFAKVTGASVDHNGWVAMSVEYQMKIDDVGEFWKGNRTGEITGGWVSCAELGDCEVTDGTFKLFPPGGTDRHQHMTYNVHFGAGERLFTLSAYKEVVSGGKFGPYEDTLATLTRIHDGHIDYTDSWTPAAIASGVLRISAVDSVTQVFTFRSAKAGPVRAFFTTSGFIFRFFLQLWKVYGIHGRKRTAVT